LCPPLTKRKAGRPRVSRFKAWFEKGESSKKGEKDEKPKRSQKGNKNRCKLCEELGHRVGSPVCRYTPERTKYVFLLLLFFYFFSLTNQMTCFLFSEKTFRSGPSSGPPDQHLVENCWPKKKTRLGGCRKKKTGPGLDAVLDVAVQDDLVPDAVLDVAVQADSVPDAVLDVAVQADPILDAVLDIVVQVDPVMDV
jgi:hypothetical protein